jgi:hypothetical protein
MHAFLVDFLDVCYRPPCLLQHFFFVILALVLVVLFCFVLQLVSIYLERRFGPRLHCHDEYMMQHTRHRTGTNLRLKAR